MKKIWIILALLLAVTLSGCGGAADETKERAEADEAANTSGDAHAGHDHDHDHDHVHIELEERMVGDIIEISEELFVAKTNDIYNHREDYLGKIVRYEGFFTSHVDQGTGTWHCFVLRNGPGCHGNDGQSGFELLLEEPWPEENDWCIVEGVLEEYEADGFYYLRLAVTSLAVTEERGAETVLT